MDQKTQKYHPVIEELVETSGENAGYIKDKDFAHEVAAASERARTMRSEMVDQIGIAPAREETLLASDREFVAIKIGERALASPHNKNRTALATGISVGEQLNEIEHSK